MFLYYKFIIILLEVYNPNIHNTTFYIVYTWQDIVI